MPRWGLEYKCYPRGLHPDARPSLVRAPPPAVTSEEYLIVTSQPHPEDFMVLRTCPVLRTRRTFSRGQRPWSAICPAQWPWPSEFFCPARRTIYVCACTCAYVLTRHPDHVFSIHPFNLFMCLTRTPLSYFTTHSLKSTDPDRPGAHRHHGTLLTKKSEMQRLLRA